MEGNFRHKGKGDNDLEYCGGIVWDEVGLIAILRPQQKIVVVGSDFKNTWNVTQMEIKNMVSLKNKILKTDRNRESSISLVTGLFVWEIGRRIPAAGEILLFSEASRKLVRPTQPI
jgi:hypothetical protein